MGMMTMLDHSQSRAAGGEEVSACETRSLSSNNSGKYSTVEVQSRGIFVKDDTVYPDRNGAREICPLSSQP